MDTRDGDLRFLKRYALVSTTLVVVLTLAAFTGALQKQRFTEIDVERINIVEPDGKLRMVISNRPRSIGPIYKGKPFGYPGGSRPGMIFFNDEGTENGGLGFDGRRAADGTYRAGAQLAFDQDQVLFLSYSDNSGQRRMGLTVADRADVSIYDFVLKRDSINKLPAGPQKIEALAKLQEPVNGVPLVAQRVYVGRDVSKSAIVSLGDRMGRARLRLLVDSLGTARIEFLDVNGRVVHRIPESVR
ncbi:MAG: hypothetical protein ABR543_12140 [Gemmatimonadaceae bacterium]